MTETMTAVAVTQFGAADVLRPITLPLPDPGPGEVRLRVRAAGVQPFDIAVRQGTGPPARAAVLPQVIGNEYAGVVDAVGGGVDSVAVGDEVLGFAVYGSYAEYRIAPVENLVRKPAGMPWEVAGSFTAGAQTAAMAIEDLGVRAGETLLVHAGAGAVGTMAVQLARLRGATVIATARQANHDYLRDLGAIPVEYGEGLVERVRALAPGGVDAALDGAGIEALTASIELGVDRDRIVTLVVWDRFAEFGVRRVSGTRSAARLAALVDLYDRGLLRAHVRSHYPLAEAADAHRDVETGHGRGRVVLVIP
ncbi:NADPH:quinone reductase-like Zn-dependent oxidoreductase [Actinokineospora baliensis]|uniref:NADP-dependent oxidoreductase n=1 Tax=Actinokineospora baliensis TaxID=547056 RepID=UPI0027DB1FE0|nr:NADP-dependent oxidoreductase [Actinokineospora baliensis]MBM7776353.1 NADPH:quinone reductase-like Zn-dependent oxidoreductase [Actinokineospora baliensis]